jgi:hypothetical protein
MSLRVKGSNNDAIKDLLLGTPGCGKPLADYIFASSISIEHTKDRSAREDVKACAR